MADTRINALSTATSSVSDDYVPIDGTTNGTRKLSAYSPSFGGNATVGGTLTVSSTTASNNTSSGALVVGNGTDGGLGVGGAINAGQAISTTQFGYTGQLTSNALAFSRNSFNYVYLNGGSSASLNFFATTTTTNDTQVMSYNNTRVAIVTTTASTSTSSGALVVSGGVGVAGAIYAGGVTNATGGVRIENSGGSFVRSVFRNNYGATDEKAWVWDVDNEGSLYLRALTDAETGSSTIISFPRLGAGAGVSSVSFNANVNHTFAGAVVANRASNAFRITTAQTPASASATGTAGTICWDSSYIYVCTATNTWKRAAISTW